MRALDERILSSVVSRDELTGLQIDTMRVLLTSHFNGVTPDQFERDLSEKNRIILLEREGRLVGFSTMLAYEEMVQGARACVIYSGDTIVAREAWGSMSLPKAWIEAVGRLRSGLGEGRCYWLLLTSGFRTYRFLPVFWKTFYPRFNLSTPGDQLQILRQLAGARFGGRFDPESGIVRFARPQRLSDGLDRIPEGRMADPHVAFFARANPGHSEGDELVCLAELCDENLTLAGRRMVGRHG